MKYQLDHVWKNQKAFQEGQTKHELSLYYFTWEKELLPEDLLLRKVLFLKVCELLEKTPSLLGKVTLPKGKLECRSLYAKTSSNQY